MILVPVVREQQQHFPTTGISLEEALKKIQNFGTFLKKKNLVQRFKRFRKVPKYNSFKASLILLTLAEYE